MFLGEVRNSERGMAICVFAAFFSTILPVPERVEWNVGIRVWNAGKKEWRAPILGTHAAGHRQGGAIFRDIWDVRRPFPIVDGLSSDGSACLDAPTHG